MALVAHNLSIGYQANKPVLQDMDFHLPESSLTCIIGDNGVGKSTLLRTIIGAIKPLKGDITVAEASLLSYSAQQRSRLFSIVLTDRIDDDLITVHELVSMGRMPYTGFFGQLSQDDERIVTSALEKMSITSLKDRHISQLSDGQRQRAMIAKAITQQTPIMILDEPTAFLDFRSRIELMEILKELTQSKISILITTHDIQLAEKFADWMWVISDGKIHEGTAEQCAKLLPRI